MGTITGPQVIHELEDVVQSKTLRENILTFEKIREMRKDPVISLVRKMFFAGVFQGKWSYEIGVRDRDSVPDEAVTFIEDQLSPMRRHFLQHGALGCFDFGYQPFEKIFDVDGNGYNCLKKLKPLLPDITSIETDLYTGEFVGLENGGVNLSVEQCLLLNFDVEGTNWYGSSQTGNALPLWNDKQKLKSGSQRYDEKVAGSHWVVTYPDGKSKYQGTDVENSVIAGRILKRLQSSGLIAMPANTMAGFNDPKARQGWTIELISATGAATDFTERFNYLDKSIARTLGFPERSILEGQHGTKSEAGEHKDFVMTMIEYRHECLLELLNWHVVNHLLRLNFGPESENWVKVTASPLTESNKQLLAKIYDTILNSPDGFLAEIDSLDVPAIAESLGIPRDDSDLEIEEPELEPEPEEDEEDVDNYIDPEELSQNPDDEPMLATEE